MAQRPRLIATDLDGTLLRSDGTISPRTLAALRAAHAAGIHLAVATARPYRAVRPIVEASPFDGWGVCQNGAAVHALHDGDPILRFEIAHPDAHALIAALRASLAGVTFAWEAGDQFGHEPGFDPAMQALLPPSAVHGDALALIRGPLTKLLAFHDAIAPTALAVAATDLAGDAMTITYSGAPFVEISAGGVTKAYGVAALCERLGIAAGDVIAFGDARNDIEMLAWAGRGVAMAHAGADVRAAASEVAATNDDDGVAAVIEGLLAG